MKRDFLSAVRVVLPVALVCLVLAIATGMFAMSPSSPASAWAALHESPATPYHNVIVVAKSGGDFPSVQKALSSITDNSPDNRYLVWVAPGTYTETVTMKQYVDIEGAGELTTRITNPPGVMPTLTGASNAELRYLTVQNTKIGYPVYDIYNDGASPSLLHVTAICSAPGSPTYAIENTNGSSPTMTDVTASASTVCEFCTTCGVCNSDSSPVMTNVKASASGGAVNDAFSNANSSPTMRNVVASCSGYGYGVDNQHSSPEIANLTITSGCYYGVRNTASSARISGGTITLTNGGTGIYNEASASPIISHINVNVSGGAGTNTGIYNLQSNTLIEHTNISVSGGTNYGVYDSCNSCSSTVNIDDSTISASTNTIYNQNSITRIGASKLAGGPVLSNGGSITCAGVYNGSYVFFPNTCP